MIRKVKYLKLSASFTNRASFMGNPVVKSLLSQAEVDEMTRDRRNNILLHGLPVQVNIHLTPGFLTDLN